MKKKDVLTYLTRGYGLFQVGDKVEDGFFLKKWVGCQWWIIDALVSATQLRGLLKAQLIRANYTEGGFLATTKVVE